MKNNHEKIIPNTEDQALKEAVKNNKEEELVLFEVFKELFFSLKPYSKPGK